jgi:hypothetical protein
MRCLVAGVSRSTAARALCIVHAVVAGIGCRGGERSARVRKAVHQQLQGLTALANERVAIPV